jgi:hypothetical protein
MSQRARNCSYSGSKTENAYGNIGHSREFSNQTVSKTFLNSSCCQKISGASMSTTLEETAPLQGRKYSSICQSLQNSIKKNSKSISQRLDCTENLLIKINRKFDDVFTHKKTKSKNKENVTEKFKENRDKFNGKMKDLIQRIIMGRNEFKNMVESSSDQSSLQSERSMREEDKVKSKKSASMCRYDRIEEESSYTGTNSFNTSEMSSTKNTKDENDMRISKEITMYGIH